MELGERERDSEAERQREGEDRKSRNKVVSIIETKRRKRRKTTGRDSRTQRANVRMCWFK
jgi:hypothetical protein